MTTGADVSRQRRSLARSCLVLAQRVTKNERAYPFGLVEAMLACEETQLARRLLSDIAKRPDARVFGARLSLLAYQEGVITGERADELLLGARSYYQDPPALYVAEAIGLGEAALAQQDTKTVILLAKGLENMLSTRGRHDATSKHPSVHAFFQRAGLIAKHDPRAPATHPRHWTATSASVFHELLSVGDFARADAITDCRIQEVERAHLAAIDPWIEAVNDLAEFVQGYETHDRTKRMLYVLGTLESLVMRSPEDELWNCGHDVAVEYMCWIANTYYDLGDPARARSCLDRLVLLEHTVMGRRHTKAYEGLSSDDTNVLCHQSRAIAAIVSLEADDKEHAAQLAELATKGVAWETQRFWAKNPPANKRPAKAWRQNYLGVSAGRLARVYASLGSGEQLARTVAFVLNRRPDGDAGATEVFTHIQAGHGYMSSGKRTAAQQAVRAALEAYQAHIESTTGSYGEDEGEAALGPTTSQLPELVKLAVEAFGLAGAADYVEALAAYVGRGLATDPGAGDWNFSIVMHLLIRQGHLTRLLELARSNGDMGPGWCQLVSEALQAIAIRLATDTLDDDLMWWGEYEASFAKPRKPRNLDSVLEIEATELARLRKTLDDLGSAFPGPAARQDIARESSAGQERQR